jgi:hypothetical protein
MASKQPYRSNARFIEIGSPGAPFRSLVNVDHITNVRFEQKIDHIEPEYDDEGKMTRPPQQHFQGWQIILMLAHGAGGQNIFIPNEDGAVALYNQILDMINGTGAPIMRLPRLKAQPKPSGLVGPDGKPVEMSPEELDALNDEGFLPGEDGVPPLTDEEIDQLEHPEIDVDAIADAVEAGVGSDKQQ